ncbi:MAG TPA: histone deacetylase family protein [Rhodopila sp.]|nr:histone deacetylase family protein [Rhodopila sp.]
MIVITTEHAGHDPEAFTLEGERRYWEVPARADALLAAVRAYGLAARKSGDGDMAPITRVHDAGYLRFLETSFSRWQELPGARPIIRAPAYANRHFTRRPEGVAGQAGWYLSAISSPIVAGTWRAALGAAWAAVEAADLVLDGAPFAYALCRPPGHHAHTDMAAGFCYLNNAAIAAQRMLDKGGGPVAILDFDVHHGNGTQQIFYARDDVYYVSVHGDPAWLYPWFAGYADETGQGPGLGWNLNLPLAPRTGNEGFVSAVGRGVEALAAKHPSALIVSAGFDAQAGDPAADMAVDADGFAAIGRQIAALELPTVLIQEGGYLVERLGANLTSFLDGLGVPRG